MFFFSFQNTEDLERENDLLKQQVELLSTEPEVKQIDCLKSARP